VKRNSVLICILAAVVVVGVIYLLLVATSTVK